MEDFALIQESLGTDLILDLDNIVDFWEHIKSPPAWDFVAALDVKYPVWNWLAKGLNDDFLFACQHIESEFASILRENTVSY